MTKINSTISRELSKDIQPGDVVRVYGVTGKTGKSKNGFYYVSNAYGDNDLHLVSLKKANGSELEGIGKRSEYWPFKHCYSSRPDIRKEYMENVKGARIENLGPVSLAVYSEFVEELKGLEKDEKNAWRANPERVAKVRAIVDRMAAENPALEKSRKWREEHPVKLDGPGLRISRNGLDVREKNGTWTHYGLTIRFEDGSSYRDGRECVYVYGSWGRYSSSTIPAGFALDVKNDTDSMTDYFDTDSARVFPGHPLYEAFKAVAQGGKAYTLTDEDAEALKAYTEARKADAEARRKEEEEEASLEEERRERHAREVIAEYAELFPGDAYHPHVVVQWSELGAMAEHAIEYAGELNPDGATVFSVDAFENITGDLDDYFKDMRGYFKLKFTYFDGESEFTDRCDLGEGTGSYGSRMRQAIEYVRKHGNERDDRVMLDGGAMVTRGEYEGHALRYLDRIPATFDELNAV